ncbi:MAG: hypothetical protein AAGI23_09355 [Bacteroidota bacterium]
MKRSTRRRRFIGVKAVEEQVEQQETTEIQITDAAEKLLEEHGLSVADIVAALEVEKVTVHTVRDYMKSTETPEAV